MPLSRLTSMISILSGEMVLTSSCEALSEIAPVA